ncbi:MAG: class I adenylate-forming enzyme family protein, partial [Pseudomonadota bacterium]
MTLEETATGNVTAAPSKWHDLLDAQFRHRPLSKALIDGSGRIWTYADLQDATGALVDIFSSQGVGPGEKVLILAENCAEVVAAVMACSRCGACAAPVNARLASPEIDRIIKHINPAVVLFARSVSPDAARHCDRLGGQPLTGPIAGLALAAGWRGSPDPDLHDVAAMLFTTGTTGPPKGVMLTHGNVIFAGQASASLRSMTASDVIYGALPVSHVFGLASVVTAALSAGTPVRFASRFSAAEAFDTLQDGVTVFSGVPQMHALLMQYASDMGHDKLPGHQLRYVSAGAAPLDPGWKRQAERFYGLALQNGYGMTEATAGICASTCEIGDPDVTVGRPLPGVTVDLDHSVGGGGPGVGEVRTRGPHVMKGYYRDASATDEVLKDGWLRTGDLGWVDESGRLTISGRLKEVIIHGGFNIYPPEVEAALNAHPLVIQSAVIGQRLAGDERVLGFVQVAKGREPDPEDLRAFLADRLAGYKRPARIV